MRTVTRCGRVMREGQRTVTNGQGRWTQRVLDVTFTSLGLATAQLRVLWRFSKHDELGGRRWDLCGEMGFWP